MLFYALTGNAVCKTLLNLLRSFYRTDIRTVSAVDAGLFVDNVRSTFFDSFYRATVFASAATYALFTDSVSHVFTSFFRIVLIITSVAIKVNKTTFIWRRNGDIFFYR